MSIIPIPASTASNVGLHLPQGINPVQLKSNLSATNVQQLMGKHPEMQKDSGLATNVKQLVELKHKLHRSGRGRGPKRGRRARRRRMQRRLGRLVGQLMGRLQKMMRQHGKHGCGPAQSTQNGADFGFLNDPKLSMNDKVELFLQKIIKDSESKMEKLMKKHEAQGQGSSSSKPGGKLLGAISKLAPMVAGILGGPVAGMAAKAIGSAVSGGADSSTESSKSSSDSDQRMTMFKIQKLQDHVKQMFDFFSTSTKKQSDLLSNIIRNMA